MSAPGQRYARGAWSHDGVAPRNALQEKGDIRQGDKQEKAAWRISGVFDKPEAYRTLVSMRYVALFFAKVKIGSFVTAMGGALVRRLGPPRRSPLDVRSPALLFLRAENS